MNKKLIAVIVLFLAVDVVGAVMILSQRGAFQKYEYINTRDYRKKDTQEVCEQVLTNLDEVIQSMLSEEGTMPNKDKILKRNAKTVREMAAELKDADLIKDYDYAKDAYTVSFTMLDDSLLIYTPPVEDAFSSGGHGFDVLSCDTCDIFTNFSATIQDWLAEVLAMTMNVEHHGSGADLAAEVIKEAVPAYSDVKAVTHSSKLDDVVEFLQSLGDAKNRVVFWRGHGNAYVDSSSHEDEVALVVGETYWFGNEPEKYKQDIRDHLIARTTDGIVHKMGFSSGFVRKYMAEAEGGLFVCGSCFGLANDSMAEAFLDKGFQAYIGANDTVGIPYSDAMLVMIAAYLTQKYPNADVYTSAGEALKAAVSAARPLYDGGGQFDIRQRGDTFRLLPTTSIKGKILADADVNPEDIQLKLTASSMYQDFVVQDDYSFELVGLDPTEYYNLVVRVNYEEVLDKSLMEIEPYKSNDLGTIDIRGLLREEEPIEEEPIEEEDNYYVQELERLAETEDLIREYGFGDIWTDYQTGEEYANLDIEIDGSSVIEYDDYYLAEVTLYHPLTLPKESGGVYHVKKTDGSEIRLTFVENAYNVNHYVEEGKDYLPGSYYSSAEHQVKGQEVLFENSYDALMDPLCDGLVKIRKDCITGIQITQNIHQVTRSDLTSGYGLNGDAYFQGIALDDDGMITKLLLMGD